MGELSPDCYACRGVGFVKPGYGVGGPSYGTFGASPAPGMYPPTVQPGFGGYGASPYGAGYPPASVRLFLDKFRIKFINNLFYVF